MSRSKKTAKFTAEEIVTYCWEQLCLEEPDTKRGYDVESWELNERGITLSLAKRDKPSRGRSRRSKDAGPTIPDAEGLLAYCLEHADGRANPENWAPERRVAFFLEREEKTPS